MNEAPLPANLEAEASLLGCLLISPATLSDVQGMVSDNDFVSEAHSLIFAALEDLHARHLEMDLVTITSFLRDKKLLDKVGGSGYLADLTGAVTTTAHAKAYAKIVADKAELRRLISYGEMVTRTARDATSPNEVFQKIESEQPQPRTTNSQLGLVSLAETWEEALNLAGDENGIGGLSTGFPSIDAITGGLRPGQNIIVFGDTGHGKSMLTQNITYNVAHSGTPVLFLGLEMTNAENTERLQGMGATADLPVLYPAANDMSYRDLDGIIRDGVAAGCGLVVIDHLHMFSEESSMTTADFLTVICKEVKTRAIKYNVPIILVSHIKERPEDRLSRIPLLSDLKGSSSIKQLADSALAVFNPGMVLELPGQEELVVMQRKSRRGMKRKKAVLNILPSARLAEKEIEVALLL